jgi:molybdenum cofactor cytidylyltransferase
MTDFDKIAVVILAAGQGRRFGSDKLMADLGGVPVGLHVARTLREMAFGWRFAVCRKDAALMQHFCAAGFDIVVNDCPESGQAHSLHLAVNAAEMAGATALLVVLADMPFVSARHISALVAAYEDTITASTDGTNAMPPAIFPRRVWPKLLTLAGDSGARALLGGAVLIAVPPAELRDIDVPADLPRPAA